ncbi:MAG: gamma-glutamyl-gamma-aminobutyrate hydrolase family protein [Candidatus Marinimicrobia bacterium]|nr:gamma-glutamyl-gamma-aminobutyrate hydrolase family protein [Candidatus Neomarinimicrobiota bacterium]
MQVCSRPLIGINSTYHEDNHRWYKVPVNYLNAVYESGGLPLILPSKTDKAELSAYLCRVDGMLFTGGSDYPSDLYGDVSTDNSDPMDHQRAKADVLLMKTVLYETDLPVFGICAGHQLLAIAAGGKLIQHIADPEKHGQHTETTHPVEIKRGKWLKSIFKDAVIIVNSNHHQAVSPERFPDEYVISARSSEGVTEAMEYRGERFILGVQWHPERYHDTAHRKAIFEKFITTTREMRERKNTE